MEGRGVCLWGVCSMGQLQVTQLHESKMRQQNRAPLHVPTDTHTHGRRCWTTGNYSWFLPAGTEGSRAVLGNIQGCSTRPHEKEECAWGGHLPQAGLGWAQYSGLDHRQDFDPFYPRYPGTGAGRPDGPVCVKTFFSEAKLLKLNLLIHIISLCLIFQWIYCFKEYVVFICRCFMAWQQGQSTLKTNATRSYEIFCISTTNMYRVVCHIMPYW